MPNYLHRTTKQYLQSISPNDLPEPEANYIYMPDLSAVQGVPSKYWVITGDVVSEMTQPEKDAVDAALLDAQRDAEMAAQLDNLESVMRQVVILMVDEINILRQQHALADRTLAQVRNQLRNNMGS